MKNIDNDNDIQEYLSLCLKNRGKQKRKNKQEEFKLQCAIVDYLNLLKKTKHFSFFAVPNGEKRDIKTAAKLKRSGVIAGVADLVILLNGGKILFVELKTDKGQVSAAQRKWRLEVENLGFNYDVWRSLDDCIKWSYGAFK